MKDCHKIAPIVLCGGSGTRLWPLSRKSFPKQFVPMIGGKSLYQLTLERCLGFGGEIMTVASIDHQFIVAEAMESVGVGASVILEPEGRNTAGAMGLAALYKREKGAGDELQLFCPADHFIPDVDGFVQTINLGVEAAKSGAIVTYGVVPGFPSTAYGYIKCGADRDDGAMNVVQFIEKPDEGAAQALLMEGAVLWNAGIFLATPNVVIKALEQHAPDILKACELALDTSKRSVSGNEIDIIKPDEIAFQSCPSKSIDYAVMEALENKVVIPFQGQWSDIGSWSAVAELTPCDEDGNRIEGDGVAQHTENTYIYAPHRPVVALGVKDLLIVDTADAILVTNSHHGENVKDVVARLEGQNCLQALTHRKVARPWGWYDCVDMGDRFQVKRIGVKPGASLSLQKHHHRAEHWVVVRGTAEVTRGEDVFLLSENQSTYIPVGQVHRLKNLGETQLEMIEVQSGEYLGEDDIERFDDSYGRVDDDE